MTPDAASPLIADAKRYAALSAIFDPVDALPEAVRDNAELGAIVASELAAASDTNPRQGTGWLLRMAERRHILDSLHAGGMLDAAIAERRTAPLEQPDRDLLDTLSDTAPFRADMVAARIADPVTDREMIERIVTALDRAGPIARAYPHIVAARLRLAGFSDAARWAAVKARGFVGRARETALLREWLQAPITAPPSRAALLTGCPGIGKSALLDEMTQVAIDRHDALVVRLDFDRAGLDVLDQSGLTREVARQLADRIGDAATQLLDARLEAARIEGGTSSKIGSVRSDLPDALAAAIGMALGKANRPVLLILDTLEVLRARGETHPEMLFGWIDRLVAAGLKPLWIMAAGRGDVLDHIPGRRGQHIALEGLDPDAAMALLRDSALPDDAQAAVLAIANGNPLVLRLAARVVAAHGAKALPQAQLASDVTAGFLYRFLLSRINDPDLRILAHPGMIARRLSADFLREVLAPELGLGGLSEARAQALFSILASEHWLVERDAGDPAFVRHRGDMRALLLPMLYSDQPKQCARIDAAALRWFGRRSDDASQLDATYHRLQLMRMRPARPMIGADIARRFDPATITELPPEAQALVQQAAGQRTSQFRGESAGAAPSGSAADATQELLRLIEVNDWGEGAYVVDQIEQGGGIDPRSLQADAIRTYYWRAGCWASARRLLAERDQFAEDDGDLKALPPQIAVARIEMRAEFSPARLTGDWLRMAATFMEIAQSLPDSCVRTGALGFALASRRLLGEQPWSRHGDPVGAAMALWGDDGRDPLVDFAFGVARDRLRARGMDAEAAGWNNPQLLAALTPYGAFAINLCRRPGREQLRDIAHQGDARLAEAGALLDDGALASVPSDPVRGIAELGLFAEWAGATAFLTGDKDVAAIGKAAERWRRTVAGDWSYARRPAAWQAAGPIDAIAQRRIDGLLRAGDPQAAAIGQLSLWSTESGEAVWDRIRQRFATSLRAVADLPDPLARAALLARRMPSAFVPAATIFTHPSTGRRHIMTNGAGMSTTQENQERRSALESRVANNPRLLDTIRQRIAAGDYPRALLDALPGDALESTKTTGSPLESLTGAAPLTALEAIIKLTGRPPMLVRDDAVVMEPLPDFEPGTDLKIVAVQKWLPSVGRIEFLNADSSWGGTGSVVEKRGNDLLVLTNRHVARLVAQRAADGRGVFLRNWSGTRMGAEVDFLEEVDSRPGDRSRTATVAAVEYLADELAADIALLRIGPGAYTPPAVFNLAANDAAFDALVALIGYPAYDPRNNASAQAKYFHDIYDVKRFAPGFVTQMTSGASFLSHDCTSLGGNSGSPLINLDTGELLGLHYAGEYLKANSAVSITTIKKVLSGAFTTVQVPAGLPRREDVEARADGVHEAGHFAGRQGFATAFLKDGAVATPWPGLTPALDATLALPSDDPGERGELRYTHFGVKYSSTDKVPLITAVNIDGGQAVRIKRGEDQWFFDGRIAREIQLGARNFADPEIDRGHMVRREDPNWGAAADAELANADTFHYVNAAAQHALLNQGKQQWQGLENYILDSSRTGGFRACVFTGPVIGLDDPVIDGARVPLEYWKLVATLDETETSLRATAYLLSQGQMIRDLLERRSRVESQEGIVLGAYRTFQIAIADLADATGYDFSAYLAADPFRRTEEAVAGGASPEPRFIPIDSLSSIII